MKPIDVILAFLRNWKKIIISSLLISVLTFFAVDFLPKTYKSELKVIVTNSNSQGNSSALGSGLNKSMLTMLKTQNQDNDPLFFEFLQSRENIVHLIQKFHLDTLYKKEAIELLIPKLQADLIFSMDDQTNIISSTMEGHNRDLIIAILNENVNFADLSYRNFQKKKYETATLQLRNRQKTLYDSLMSSISNYTHFLKKNNVYDIDKQLQLSIENRAKYEKEFSDLKAKRDYISLNNSPNSPEMIDIENQLKSVQKNLDISKNKQGSIYVNSTWAVDNKASQSELEAKIKFQEEIYYMTSAELTKVESELAKNTPVIQIVQSPYYADWKTKPKRLHWALAIFAFSFVTLFLISLVIDYKKRLFNLDPEIIEFLNQITNLKK